MFSNFIYFIVVVLIYSTYQPSAETNFSPTVTLFLFVFLLVLYSFLSRLQFNRIMNQLSLKNIAQLDNDFNATLKRQSITAVVLFAINIYALNLSSFLMHIPLFSMIPTLEALLFLGVFIAYLSIMWNFAHPVYRKLYLSEFSKRAYILSNISFSVPVLLPWLFLSGIADLINALPFELPKQFLATTEGEVVYFLTFLFVIAIIGPLIIQKFWGCEPLEPGETRRRIESLCRESGLEYNNILYWPIFGGKMITAGVMGLVKKFRYILVTQALLHILSPEELDAVIAHEIGHIKKKHLLFYLFFFGGYMLLSYATFDLIIFIIIYIEPLYRFIINAGLNQATLISTLMSVVIIVNFIVYFRYVFGYFMRNFERQADTYVYTVSTSAEPLINTLQKIALTSGQSAEKPNWHHFSIVERINYLKKCELDKTWISRHNNKVKRSIAIYMAGLVLFGGIGYHLNFGKAGKNLSNYFSDKIIHRELERTPDNPELYSMLGDLQYSRKNFYEAVQSYEQSLRLAPRNPRVLNNLAWLYATCEDEQLKNPEKAIRLAERAAALEEAPHILDTLAESYYANKDYKKAVVAGKHALAIAHNNRGYFEKQLKKFSRAFKKSEIGI